MEKKTYGITAASAISGWVSNKASSSAGGTYYKARDKNYEDIYIMTMNVKTTFLPAIKLAYYWMQSIPL